MFLSSLYAITDDTAGEDLIMSHEDNFTSDILDLQAAGINDQKEKVYLNIYLKAATTGNTASKNHLVIVEQATNAAFNAGVAEVARVVIPVGSGGAVTPALGELLKTPLKTGSARYLRVKSTIDTSIGSGKTITCTAFLSTS